MNFSRHSVVYFKAEHIFQKNGAIDIYRYLPRPYASLAVMIYGGWDFREYHRGEPDSTGRADVGDLLFVPMGSTYDGVWECGDGRVHIISLHFELDEIGIFGSQRSGVQAIRGEDFAAALGNPESDYTKEFLRIAEICDSSKDNPTARECFELMWHFYRLLEAAIPCLTRRDETERDTVLDPALKYLKQNFTSPCPVPELARLCNLSDSQFFVRFKRATGVTPIEYKNRLMVSNAERLLLDEPDLPIEEVAGRMGFSSSTYFRRIFKKMSSYSPRDFRKNAHESL